MNKSRDLFDRLSPDQRRVLLASLVEKRGESARTFPLSFAQQRLWFLDHLSPGSPFYNQYQTLRLPFALDPAVFERALAEIIKRHDSLRVTFSSVNGQPAQIVEPGVSFSLPVIDLSGIPLPEQEAEALRLATEEVCRPFDLSCGPLMRATLLRLHDQEYVFLLTLHHIISDGWSMTVFFRELNELYDAFAQGMPSPLAPLPIQYPDFALWQRQYLQGRVLEQQLSYWRDQLRDLPLLQFPTDHPRPEFPTFRGGWSGCALPLRLAQSLRALSHREGVTLFMLLLAAFQALLSRYTGQDDIVVGAPIANRNRAELEGLIGFFVNTLVMRTDLAGAPDFIELLGRVKRVALDAFAHQDLPFEKLVEDLQPARDVSRNPLFQVTFQVFNQPEVGRNRLDPSQPVLEVSTNTSVFDLAVSVFEDGEQLDLQIDYSSDLFEAETIRRLTSNFILLLEAIAENPQRPISDLPLVAPAERHRLLFEWNDTTTAYPQDRCVPALVQDWALRTPDALAVSHNGATLTYGEINHRAERIAAHLARRGIGPGRLVAVSLERSPDWIAALLGVWKAGAAFVPVDRSLPAARLSWLLEDCGSPILLDRDFLDEALVRDDKSPAAGRAGLEDLAYVIYTSGSTGKPKGVAVSHRSLLNLVFWHLRQYEVCQNARASQVARASFDASVWEVWPYLSAGASIHIYDQEVISSPSRLVQQIVANRIEYCFLPTPLAEAALNESWPETIGLRVLLTGGDVLRLPSPNDLPFALVNHYGPTEAAVVTTFAPIPQSSLPRKSPALPPIGHPIANTRLYVLDGRGNPAPIGVAGELHIAGDGVAQGYYNQADLTAERFIPCPFEEAGARMYRTGDLVRFRFDGNLEFLGRADQQVKIRGFRIEPGEIEAAMLTHPAVNEAAVVARHARNKEKILCAFVTLHQRLDPGELKRRLQSQLPDYMVPSFIIPLDQMPFNSSGKIDRLKLPDPDLADNPHDNYVAPQNDSEAMIAEVWREILALPRVSVEDNFFDVGGHSLLMVKLQSRLTELLNRQISLLDLFRYPTVASQARALADGPPASNFPDTSAI